MRWGSILYTGIRADVEIAFGITLTSLQVEHISKLVNSKLYDGCCFYRSDFVIQCGLQVTL